MSQTPLALTRNVWPSRCIAPASTDSTTGRPRRAPTRVAVSRSGERWTSSPAHGPQALGADRVQGRGDGAVVEVRGRGRRGQSEVDVHGVALAGADPGALDREAPLVVGGDDMVELVPRDAEAVGGGRGEQRPDLDPAALVEGQADPLGLVTQMLREVLRHLDGASFIHPVRVAGISLLVHVIFLFAGLIHSQVRLSTGYLTILWTTFKRLAAFDQQKWNCDGLR